MAEMELQESVIHINRVAKVVKAVVILLLPHSLPLEMEMGELELDMEKAQKFL